MARYTLHVEDEDFENTLSFDADNLDDVLMFFKMFIQGSGFTWVQGELEFVQEDTEHSIFYFDTERNR